LIGGSLTLFPCTSFQNANACEYLIKHCGAAFDPDMIPGARDLSTNFVDIREYLGQDFTPPCTQSQELLLKRNRNLFTSGEDNLVLRGVNLYGEKQWMLISDRFMPERSINSISQRHGTLCYMLYKSRGVEIDEYGESMDQIRSSSFKLLSFLNTSPHLRRRTGRTTETRQCR
jgi:hypothetical protein